VSTGLEVSGLVKRYGAQTALDGVSVTAGAGEFFTLLGPSGCGKTTLLRCVAGFARPDGGRIVCDGARLDTLPAHARDIGMVFQNYAIFPHLSVRENIAYGLRARRVPAPELARRVGEALDLVQMADLATRMPTQLSGGQQQRVALARALVVRPRLLLMDEPLSNLDARLRVTMRGEIRRIQRELGITTLYVTHDQEEALAVSDRVAVMERGRVEQVGTPWEVYAEPRTAFVAQFVGLSNAVEGMVVAREGRRVTVDAGGLRLEGETDLPDPRLLAVFRPEAVQLHVAGTAPAGPSGGEGRLAGAEFLGAVLRCGIRTAAGALIVADVHKPTGHAVKTEGQPVRFTVAPGDVRFFRAATPR
jgi:iron(III) transport system ATP-binding protein